MTTKILWAICGTLALVLIGQLILASGFVSADTRQKIAGTKVNLPEPEKKALVSPPKKNSGAGEPQILAKSVILMDVESSYVMYAKNTQEKVPVASTTKIMTALVVLENHSDKLQDIVTVTYPMTAVEGSDIDLKPGEKMTVENLLKGLLIRSGNDTAYSLAAYFGGKDNFVLEMNKKVRDLGLANTQFKDPAGLDDEGLSTAHDLAFLAAYAMRNTTFQEIVKTPKTTITSADGTISHELESSNRMLRVEEQFFFPFTVGIKTGFTDAAGHCLVSAAQKDGHTLVGVILNTNENTLVASAKESKKILEWGFANWTW